MGPSRVQVQLLHGFIRLLEPKSILILFTRQDFEFSRHTVKSIDGKLAQGTRGFLSGVISYRIPNYIEDILERRVSISISMSIRVYD